MQATGMRNKKIGSKALAGSQRAGGQTYMIIVLCIAHRLFQFGLQQFRAIKYCVDSNA